MSKAAKEFVAFISEPATIEISAGVVRVRERSGATHIELAMSVRTFARYVRRAKQALDRHEAGDDNIVIDD